MRTPTTRIPAGTPHLTFRSRTPSRTCPYTGSAAKPAPQPAPTSSSRMLVVTPGGRRAADLRDGDLARHGTAHSGQQHPADAGGRIVSPPFEEVGRGRGSVVSRSSLPPSPAPAAS